MAISPTYLPIQGSTEPTFIVKCNDTYYVTHLVAAYNLDQAATDEERADTKEVIAAYEEARKAGHNCDAVRLAARYNLQSMQQSVKLR